jgi:serine/threonine protein phosphatase PrpC
MGDSFQIYGISEKEQEKPRNGDFILYEVVDEERIVLALLADGVSNSPCDWLASKTACESFMIHFRSEKGLSIESRMHSAGKRANEALIYHEDQYGMLCAFSAVAGKIGCNEYYYLSVGDTRIYRISGENSEQITEDDVDVQYLRRNGRIATNKYGQPLARRVITNALGSETCIIDVKKGMWYENDLIILASDGFYNSYGIINEIRDEVNVSENLKNALGKIWCKNMEGFEDDASVLVIYYQ